MDYRNSTALNASSLSLVNQAENWQHFNWLREQSAKRTPSGAMALGTAIHAGVLEPEKNLVVKAPGVSKRSIAGKELHILHEAALLPGQISLDESDYDRYRKCVIACESNKTLAALIARGAPEKEIYFEYKGVECKSKLDLVGDDFILDLKTTSESMLDFPKVVSKYMYHRQLAFYSLAHPAKNVYIAAVKTDEPYSVQIFKLSESYLNLGLNLVDQAIFKYKTLKENLSDETSEIITLEPELY
jgi:hypothetical protein